jgi:hypothetical protein
LDRRVNASMKEPFLCPLCGSRTERIQSAFISPWVRELTDVRKRTSKFHLCTCCASGFFDYRYSDNEMNGLYNGYRGGRYIEVRQKWEPSYTDGLNSSLGNDAQILKIRHEFVLSALGSMKPGRTKSVHTVIDVGGDQGQFIPDAFPNKYVLDVSGKANVDGVARVPNAAAARSLRPDLVMACGVFEHVPHPVEFMQELLGIGSTQGTMLLYVEVPSGVPQRRPPITRAVNRLIGSATNNSRFMWSMVDKHAARLRVQGQPSTRLMPMRQSEHINFFSAQGLRHLAERCGGKVVFFDQVGIPSALLSGGRIQFSGSFRMLVETVS